MIASSPEPTWDILICSIEHRTEKLERLLTEIGRQLTPGVGVKVLRDNLQMGYGEKCSRLLCCSDADYVCFADDDDLIAPLYVKSIMEALRQRPDYVGFKVRFTEDGELQLPVVHSLEHAGWANTANGYYRDIVHFNPIRRVLAMQGPWTGGNGADFRWAQTLRELGCVQSEVFIPEELYYYEHVMADTFEAPRTPLTEHPPRPDFWFVDWL